MKLHSPFKISSRLLPALEIGGASIQLEYSKRPGSEGRTRYYYTIDLPGHSTAQGQDLQSGCQGGNLREGFISLLSFLSAAGESFRYHRGMKEDSNTDLFPKEVCQWAARFSDELTMAQIELEENPDLIEE